VNAQHAFFLFWLCIISLLLAHDVVEHVDLGVNLVELLPAVLAGMVDVGDPR
jgi:hypothetical protein